MIKLHEKELLEIKVVDYLFTHKNSWLITQNLIEKLNIGATVLHRVLDSLSQHLSSQGITLNISKNKGIKITCGNDYPIQKICESIYTSSLVYKIIIAHFKETYISTTNFAIENYTSTATIQRKVSQINTDIGVYDICLKRGKIEGKEENVRKFIYTYFWNIHHSNVLSNWNTREGERLADFLEEKTGLRLTRVGREKFLLYYSITNLRERKGRNLNSISKNIKLVSQFSNYFSDFKIESRILHDEEGYNFRFLLVVFLAFQDNYQNNSKLSLDKLYETLITNFKEYCKDPKKMPLNGIEEAMQINHLVMDLEKKASFLYNKKEKKEMTLKVLSMYWQETVMFLDLLEDSFYTCTNKLQKEFPQFVEELRRLIPKNCKETTRKILLEALCGLALKINIRAKLSKIFYITIVLTKGELYEDIAKDTLKRTLTCKYILKFLPKENSHNADLIITDFPQLMSEDNNLLFIRDDIISGQTIVIIEKLLSQNKKRLC